MDEATTKLEGLAAKPPATGLQLRGTFALDMDVLADNDTGKLHVLSRDAIIGLRTNVQSDEGEMFSACFAIFLTVLPLLITLLAGVYQGSVVFGKLVQVIILALFALTFASGGGTWFFFRKRRTVHEAREEKFEKILKQCRTVMTLHARED